MARIATDKKEDLAAKILAIVADRPFGIRESEIAEISGIERRTVYNYLKRLQIAGRVTKKGYSWSSTNTSLDAIESDLVDAIHRLFEYLRKPQ